MAPLLERRNATVTHELSAIGHAHLDTAWLWPLAESYRKAVRGFADAGCRYIQLDEVNFTYLCDPKLRQQVTERGDDPLRKELHLAIAGWDANAAPDQEIQFTPGLLPGPSGAPTGRPRARPLRRWRGPGCGRRARPR